MAQPSVLVLRAPGTNCEIESAFAFQKAGATTSIQHLNQVLENPGRLRYHQILCIPGGFSYGDDIASGRVFANRLDIQLADGLREFVDAGKLVLGICNGFQVLLRSGLLRGAGVDDTEQPCATLTLNNSGRYEDRWVHLRVEPTPCVFLQGVREMYLPLAHAEGRFVASSPSMLQALGEAGRLPLRYTSKHPGQKPVYPENPSGAMGDVAGMCDESGRVFGLMPHPERHLDPTHHPYWTRLESLPQHGDGFAIFANATAFFA